VTLLDYILNLHQQVFSLWTFLSCGRDKEHTDLCVLIIPQEQALLHVLTRPGKFVPSTIPREQGWMVTMPKFVCLRDFSKNPHGSTQYPLFRATVLAVSPSWVEDISPKVVTPLCVPLTVEMFACDTSTAHYYCTCWPLYPRHWGRDYPKFNFNLLLMTFYNPVQEYQTTGWSQKTTLHHFIMMGKTFSRDIYTSQYSSRAHVQNYLPPGQRRKLLEWLQGSPRL